MYEYLNQISESLGISIFLVIFILFWSYIWKLLALWKSARKNSPAWFIILALVNTVGILEILYIFVFSKMKKNNFKRKKSLKRKR
jgi:methionyl-tRNA synthetase